MSEKYSKDGPFTDPVVRCDACQKLLLVKQLNQMGMCKHCSNTKVRNLRSGTGEDWAQMKEWVDAGEMDADFLAVFEGNN